MKALLALSLVLAGSFAQAREVTLSFDKGININSSRVLSLFSSQGDSLSMMCSPQERINAVMVRGEQFNFKNSEECRLVMAKLNSLVGLEKVFPKINIDITLDSETKSVAAMTYGKVNLLDIE